MDPRIADYIRDNRRRYTKQALTDQLLEAGYSREAIDATWAVLATPDRDSTAGPGFWNRFWLFLVGTNVVVFLGVVLLSGMLGGGGGILAVILAVVLAIGALIAWGVVAVTQPTKLGHGTALAMGAIIPLFFALLIGGTCYALVGGLGVGGPAPITGTMSLTIEDPLAFDGAGSATCQPHDVESGFSIYGDQLGTLDGRSINVSLDVYAGGPNGTDALSPNVMIYLLGGSSDQQEIGYGNIGASSEVRLDANATAFAGSVQFTDLAVAEAMDPSAPGPDRQPISGRISWKCG